MSEHIEERDERKLCYICGSHADSGARWVYVGGGRWFHADCGPITLRGDIRACGLNGCDGKPTFVGPDCDEQMRRHLEDHELAFNVSPDAARWTPPPSSSPAEA